MLLAVRLGRFSETAGSHHGHGEAGRGKHHVAASAVVSGVDPDDVAERAAESAEAVEPDLEADLGDVAVRFAEHEHRSLDAAALEVAMRSLPECGTEGADEVGFGDVRHAGEARYVEGLGVGAVDGVAGAEHAAVELLDGEGHNVNVRASPIPRLCRYFPTE